jgi:hypothetical protein
MSQTVTIRGDKELIAKLKKLEPKRQEAAMKAMGLHVAGKMKVYPPQRPVKYVRTGILGKRWDYKAKQDEVLVFNQTPYASYVQGDDSQTWFHRATGWQMLKKTVLANADELVALLKKQIDRILEHG